MYKFCNSCKKNKLKSEFSKHKRMKDGLQCQCKSCVSLYKKEYVKINKEKISLQKKNHYLRNRIKVLEDTKKYQNNNIDKYKEYKIQYYIDNKEKIKQKSNYYRNENYDIVKQKKKEYYKNNKETILKDNKKYSTSFALYNVYHNKLTVEESPILSKDGVSLEVKCRYCGKYFIPTNAQISNRINSLNNIRTGVSSLYCSDNCKDSCPIFNQQKFPKGFKPSSSREVNPLIRQMCFERDDWKCQICGATQTEAPLHCHHIEGYTQNPALGNDVTNTITLCKTCHKEVHKQPGCKYHELRCNKNNYYGGN